MYRDVRDSLEGSESKPGSFDLMNKGITILAVSARLVDKDEEISDEGRVISHVGRVPQHGRVRRLG